MELDKLEKHEKPKGIVPFEIMFLFSFYVFTFNCKNAILFLLFTIFKDL